MEEMFCKLFMRSCFFAILSCLVLFEYFANIQYYFSPKISFILSRLVTKLDESKVLETEQEKVVLQAATEGFITDDTVAIDATHFEARDQAPTKEEKPKPEPKKRDENLKVSVKRFIK